MSKDQIGSDDFITIDELQPYLRIGRSKAYELANTKGFPTFYVGSKMIFSKRQVREWVEQQVDKKRNPQKLKIAK